MNTVRMNANFNIQVKVSVAAAGNEAKACLFFVHSVHLELASLIDMEMKTFLVTIFISVCYVSSL